jgi:hypothetical protein
MEATYSSETSVDFQRATRLCIPEDRTLHNHRCENLSPTKTVFCPHSVLCTLYGSHNKHRLFLYTSWSKGPNRIGVSPHLRTETDPVFETHVFVLFLVIIKIRTMDKVRNPSNSVCYTPSSEPYRIYIMIPPRRGRNMFPVRYEFLSSYRMPVVKELRPGSSNVS